ncbi:MAG: NAD(P)-dependent oxidoreductase [Peptostreptococcaceae bacterium]|nr:NAD(P)-dependent oxidoreductase [Peptostreptococcaceae bacterium]
MKKIIITGADGFVGSNTVRYFLENHVEILAIDIIENVKNLKEHKNLTYMKADVTKPKEFLNRIPQNEYDTFIHFAWAGSAGPGRTDYNLQMDNAIYTVECLKVAKQLGCKRFLCAGSIMEKEVVAAVNKQGNHPGMGYVYGMGKLIAHQMCKSVASEIGIDLVWPIITNTYGEGELSPRFVNTTIRKIINKEPLEFTSATQNYDFVHISDVARAFYLIAEKGKPFFEYIIGSSNAKPLKEFVLELQQELAPDIVPLFGNVSFTGTNMPLSTFDTSYTENDTGFKAKVSFSEGTRRTMNWLKTLNEEQYDSKI